MISDFRHCIAILSQSILMSHALKKAAVVPTDAVKHEAGFNGRKKEHLLGVFFKLIKLKN